MKLKLTQGKVALVDEEDFERVSKYKWHYVDVSSNRARTKAFYARALIDGKNVYLHRLITNALKGKVVDHKNHDTLDNRKENLRICTRQENQRNCLKRSNNTSGFRGVSWRKQHKKWEAKIKYDGKTLHLGMYVDKNEAAKRWNEVAKTLYGEFAYLN